MKTVSSEINSLLFPIAVSIDIELEMERKTKPKFVVCPNNIKTEFMNLNNVLTYKYNELFERITNLQQSQLQKVNYCFRFFFFFMQFLSFFFFT